MDGRFSYVSNEINVIEGKMEKIIPLKTRKQNNWTCNVWDDWATWRNTQENSHNKFKRVPLIDEMLENGVDYAELGHWLVPFVLEVKRKDGLEYPPNSIYQICIGLQRTLKNANQEKYRKLEIFSEGDPNFRDFNVTLNFKMKELTSKGLGVTTKSATPLSQEDEDQLWETGTINLKTSFGLSNGVFFYNCKVFGLITMDEHKKLSPKQYSFGVDPISGKEKLTFDGRVRRKNRRSNEMSEQETTKIEQFRDPSNQRCVYTLFKCYLDSIPMDGAFYRRPLNNSTFNGGPRFSDQTIGVNKLSTKIRDMFSFAGISIEGKNISNRSVYVAHFFDETQTGQKRAEHSTNDVVPPCKRPGLDLMRSPSDSELDIIQPSADVEIDIMRSSGDTELNIMRSSGDVESVILKEERVDDQSEQYSERTYITELSEGTVSSTTEASAKPSRDNSRQDISHENDVAPVSTTPSESVMEQLPYILKTVNESGLKCVITITDKGISIIPQ